MKIASIEPTPSPNTMKINLDESLPKGVLRTYTSPNPRQPEFVNRILQIAGVRSVFHTADFLAIDRLPQAAWQPILSQVRDIVGTADAASGGERLIETPAELWGEVKLFVQTFRGIPMQIRIQTGTDMIKAALPDRFVEAGLQAGSASAALLRERKLEDWGTRYGDPQEVAAEVVEEIDASYPEDRLRRLVARAIEQGEGEAPPELRPNLTVEEAEALWKDANWKVRYAALQRIPATAEALPLLARALKDTETSIRRMAVVRLGELQNAESLPNLIAALQDRSPVVRRTAGDTLNDLGDPAAIEPMMAALQDSNKLVRWRAARFLYEHGDVRALDALRRIQDDPEFEVSLQARMALARIESGQAAEGSVWQQMTRRGEEERTPGE